MKRMFLAVVTVVAMAMCAAGAGSSAKADEFVNVLSGGTSGVSSPG
jgi:TRAP-type uncharacterized transport system substrate-binding protein